MTANRYDVNDEIYLSNQLTSEDIPSLVKYLNNETVYTNTLNIPFPYTTKHGENFIQQLNSSSAKSMQLLSIRLKANNELIGACGMHRAVQNERRAAIGYWLGEPYWHRGIMPKVVKKVIDMMKSEWTNLVRIEAQIFSWNIPSMRVVEKNGFAFEGILRKYFHKNGMDMDVHSYALIIE